VRQLIRQNAVVLRRQRADHRLVGGVAGIEQQRARIAEPVGQLRLQRRMGLKIARYMPGRPGADAVARRALLPGVDNARIVAQTKIIVAGEVAVTLAFMPQPACAVRRQQATLTQTLLLPTRLQGLSDAMLPAHYCAAL